MKIFTTPKRRAAAFSLMEVLVVISIIALLASMTMGAFSYAQRSAMRNRTTAMHRGIISGLENYHSEYGEYPTPASDGVTEKFGTKTYETGGAMMLYQALSGDGTDKLRLAGGGGSSSDNKWTEGEKMMLSEMPKEFYTRGNSNVYMLLDAFGHPFQYTKGGTMNAVNPSYDLWSYGEDDMNTKSTDKTSKLTPKVSAKWIKNF
ncbi:MAG: prepilin-type N-terminal cleavage/methylation domain-containing protein [Verrucomicrobiaceae bacterium]|nr:prepilin-type N-terminal cleavage/methylation domain-containing protein [Verrucomicrobiaceae bacterium]